MVKVILIVLLALSLIMNIFLFIVCRDLKCTASRYLQMAQERARERDAAKMAEAKAQREIDIQKNNVSYLAESRDKAEERIRQLKAVFAQKHSLY